MAFDLLSNLSGGTEGPSQLTSGATSGSLSNFSVGGGGIPNLGSDPASMVFRGQNIAQLVLMGGLAILAFYVFLKK